MVDYDEHHHCKVCGKVCGPDDQTCSRVCEEKRVAQARSRQNWMYLFGILIAAFVLLFVLQVS